MLNYFLNISDNGRHIAPHKHTHTPLQNLQAPILISDKLRLSKLDIQAHTGAHTPPLLHI